MNKAQYIQKAKEVVLRSMRYNQGFVTVMLSAVILSLSYSNSNKDETIKEKDQQIIALANQATYVSDAGVIKQYERERLDVYRERPNVENILSKYLVQSAYKLTNGYKQSYFTSEEELFKKYVPFQEFFKEYIHIDLQKSGEEKIKGYQNALKDWQQIVVYFRNKINKNSIPQVIDKKESEITTKVWETSNENFTVRFLIPMYVTSRTNNNTVDEGMTMAEIEAKGYFNLLEKTTLNARGMKFTSLKLLHPEIDHEAK